MGGHDNSRANNDALPAFLENLKIGGDNIDATKIGAKASKKL